MRASVGLAALVVVATASRLALAHGGGGYRGPKWDPPPDVRAPADPPHPIEDERELDFARWWPRNRDAILRPRIAARVSRAAIESALPVLRALLGDPSQPERVRAASAVALARMGDGPSAATLKTLASAGSEEVPPTLRGAATLALGFLRRDDPGIRAFLVELVRDTSRDGSPVRPCAAVALGLHADTWRPDPGTSAFLMNELSRSQTDAEVKPACFIALALCADSGVVQELVAVATYGRLPSGGAEFGVRERMRAMWALGRVTRARDAANVTDALLAFVARGMDDVATLLGSAIAAPGRPIW